MSYEQQYISYSIFTKKSKNRASGLATISIRITIDGNHVEFSSKLTGDPKLWDARSERMTGKSKAALETNQSINQILSRLNAKYREVLDINGYITAEKLRDSFLGLDEQKNTLLTLLPRKSIRRKPSSVTEFKNLPSVNTNAPIKSSKDLFRAITKMKISLSKKSNMTS